MGDTKMPSNSTHDASWSFLPTVSRMCFHLPSLIKVPKSQSTTAHIALNMESGSSTRPTCCWEPWEARLVVSSCVQPLEACNCCRSTGAYCNWPCCRYGAA